MSDSAAHLDRLRNETDQAFQDANDFECDLVDHHLIRLEDRDANWQSRLQELEGSKRDSDAVYHALNSEVYRLDQVEKASPNVQLPPLIGVDAIPDELRAGSLPLNRPLTIDDVHNFDTPLSMTVSSTFYPGHTEALLGQAPSGPRRSHFLAIGAVSLVAIGIIATQMLQSDKASAPSVSVTDSVTVAPVTSVTVAKVAETPITIPTGVLAAIPVQNRLDVAKGVFQVQLVNDTTESLEVVAVQFVWDGLTTPVANRTNRLLAGDRIDYPVPLAPAICLGDGTRASMPSPQSAIVRVTLLDDRVIDVPVFDVMHFARKLYLKDCERQHILRQVDIQFAELQEVMLEGRPVTEGVLRLTRRQSSNRVVVTFVSNTINFTFVPMAGSQAPVATLRADQAMVEVPIRFIEGRCDAHALSESSQPFNFYVSLLLGDGAERSFATVPAIADQIPMRRRVETACEFLGKNGFAGE